MNTLRSRKALEADAANRATPRREVMVEAIELVGRVYQLGMSAIRAYAHLELRVVLRMARFRGSCLRLSDDVSKSSKTLTVESWELQGTCKYILL